MWRVRLCPVERSLGMSAFCSLDVTRAYGLDFLFPIRDRVIGASLRRFGEFAKPEIDIISEILAASPGGTYVDVGANIGSIALPVASIHPRTTVLCVEANRLVAQILAANALANRLSNVGVIHAAAGSQPGLAAFPVPPLDLDLNFGAIGFEAGGASLPRENVRVCTLDEIAPPRETRMVKIDVEGFEREVLAGGQRTFREDRPAWIFETKHDHRSADLIQTFLDADYDLFWLFAPFVTRQAHKEMMASPNLSGDTNVLALPSGCRPPFEMTQVRSAADRRPSSLEGYPYLSRYGYS